MRRYAHWAMPGIPEAQDFVQGSREIAFEPGIGLVGAVWQSGEPLWLANSMTDPRALRKGLSQRTGLAAALLVPVRSAGRVVAVLDVTCRRIRQPDKRLMQALGVIAGQIGQFLRRAEAEARDARERGALPLAHRPLLRLVLGAGRRVPLHPARGPRRSPAATSACATA